MPTRRAAPMLLAFWVAAVVLATAVGVVAVRLVARQVGDPAASVLSSKDVGEALSSRAPTPSPKPTPSRATPPATRSASPRPGSAPPPAQSTTRPFSTTGGSVGVRCVGGAPQRVYATPAQGWVLDESSTEGGVLEVRFQNGRTRSRIEIRCNGSAPVVVDRRVDTSGGDD